MKVVVCIKQVPDTKGGVKFKPDGTLDRGAMLAIMNPDDKAGLEAALRLKDQYGAEVTVLTMGLPKADAVLREALAMGADKAVLVTDRVLGGADTWATSSTIAGALRSRILLAPMDTTIKARKACIRAFMTKNSSSKTDPTAVKTSVNVVTTYLPFLITSMVLATTPSSG